MLTPAYPSELQSVQEAGEDLTASIDEVEIKNFVGVRKALRAAFAHVHHRGPGRLN